MQTEPTARGRYARHVPALPRVSTTMKIANILTALSLTLFPLAAVAQPVALGQGIAPTLAVSGEGTVERSPDTARLAVSIVTNDDNAARSAGKNTDIYNALKARAGGLGISASGVKTTAFNVRFVAHPPKGLPPEQREPRYGYVTSRSLSIDVSPIENVGKVVDAASAAGATDIGDVNFDLRDRKSAYRQALGAAFNDAKANAAALASAGGLHIVRVKTVSSENARMTPFAGPVMMRAAAAESAPSPTQIEPSGPIVVRASVTVVYEIQ